MTATHCNTRSISPEKILSDFARHLCAQLGLGQVTINNHVSTIRRLLPSITIRPTLLKVEKHIEAMHKAKKSYSHISNTSVSIELFTAFLGRPIKLGRPQKPKTLIRGTLSEAEITLLINAAHTLRERAILAVLCYSGIRNKELCGLRIGNVDFANQCIEVCDGKGAKDRNADIASACLALLVEYLKERGGMADDLLFITLRHGDPYQPQVLRKLVRACAKRAGIKKRVWPHLLRHSLATNLLHRGANLLAIKDQLGHVFIETTMRYVHSSPVRMRMEYRMFAPSYI